MNWNNYADKEKMRNTRNAQRKRYYSKTQHAPNHYSRWTIKELNMVEAHEISDMELSKKIGRSVSSIQGMRSKIKNNKEKYYA